MVLIDGSRVIIESLVKTGAEVFIGYPITPANLLYTYGRKRFPMFIPASDEITALQMATGFAASGKLPVTATSFPGFALMLESINMAYMMEMPMVIILVQRMGPSTGSATTGAQGDLLLLRGVISGGNPIPVLCPSNLEDCWDLTSKCLKIAVELRTPVVLLTSKEMIMTNNSFDLDTFAPIEPVEKKYYKNNITYKPYAADENMAPPFLPLGHDTHQVRINSSTHDPEGYIKKNTPDAIANTTRLRDKIEKRIDEYSEFHFDKQENSEIIIVSYGISALAALDAVKTIRSEGRNISNLILKTLLPVPPEILEILNQFNHIIFVEENASGLLREIIYGQYRNENIRGVNKIGDMITPQEIINEVSLCQQV